MCVRLFVSLRKKMKRDKDIDCSGGKKMLHFKCDKKRDMKECVLNDNNNKLV